MDRSAGTVVSRPPQDRDRAAAVGIGRIGNADEPPGWRRAASVPGCTTECLNQRGIGMLGMAACVQPAAAMLELGVGTRMGVTDV